jgi:hypothetical protein
VSKIEREAETMRRFAVSFLAAVTAAAFLATGALAKEGGVELSSAPYGTNAGDPWNPTMQLIDGTPEMLAQAKPGIRIHNDKTGFTQDFSAKPTEKPGVYTVEVIFPDKGFWTYEAYDGVSDRTYEYPVVYIDGPATAPVSPSVPTAGDTDAFPVWPFIGGGITFLLLVAWAAFALRQRRPGLQH